MIFAFSYFLICTLCTTWDLVLLRALYLFHWSYLVVRLSLYRLEHIDEILRSARLSSYLFIRAVLLIFLHYLYILLNFTILCALSVLFFSIEMDSIAWRTWSHRWNWSWWLASTLCSPSGILYLFIHEFHWYFSFFPP